MDNTEGLKIVHSLYKRASSRLSLFVLINNKIVLNISYPFDLNTLTPILCCTIHFCFLGCDKWQKGTNKEAEPVTSPLLGS